MCQILDKGELQVSAKEREHEAENKFKDIAHLISEKCINTETNRPFPVSIIEQCLHDMHFNLHPTKTAKQQALEAIRELEKTLPIRRASMRLRILLPTKIGKAVKAKLQPLYQTLEDESFHAHHELLILIEPGAYRQIDECVSKETKGQGTLEVVDTTVHDQGDENLDE
jgi:ribosome maturation protein SDO1